MFVSSTVVRLRRKDQKLETACPRIKKYSCVLHETPVKKISTLKCIVGQHHKSHKILFITYLRTSYLQKYPFFFHFLTCRAHNSKGFAAVIKPTERRTEVALRQVLFCTQTRHGATDMSIRPSVKQLTGNQASVCPKTINPYNMILFEIYPLMFPACTLTQGPDLL